MKLQPSNLFVTMRARLKKAGERVRSFRKHTANSDSHASLEQKLILAVKQPSQLPSLAQLTHLPAVLRRTERIVLGVAVAVFVISLGFLASNLVARTSLRTPISGGSYTEAAIGSPGLVNPLWADASGVDRDLTALIFAGLFRIDRNLTPVPDLAESYTVSEDGKIYTITLKPNLFWHDGEPLTAGDISFTVHAIQDPVYGSIRKSDFTGVTVEATDAQTIVFTLERPNGFFLHALTVGIIPEHLWATTAPVHARLSELNLKPVGAGPFQLKSIKKTRRGFVHSYTLARFPHYHATPPLLDTMVFRFFDDYTAGTQAIARGNADGLAFIPTTLEPIIARRGHLTRHTLALPQTTAIFFNQKKSPILAEKNIRAALAYAIEKSKLITDAFGGNADLLDGPLAVTPPADLPRYLYDNAAADRLLVEAGWVFKEGATVRTFKPKNRNDKRFVAESVLKVKLTVVDVPEHVRAAELVREAWIAIGVQTEMVTVAPDALAREVLLERSFEALLHGYILPATQDPYPFWHSSQAASPGTNITQYANRRADGLLEEARALLDPAARATRYQEFQNLVATELPAIFLLSPHYQYVMDERIKGVSFDRLANPEHRFADVTNWHVKTK